MKKYIFPLNFDYSNKFLGIFEYKTLTPTCILGVILAIIISKLCENTLNGIVIFIIVFLPIFLLANTKIFNEPILSFALCIAKHYLTCSTFVNKSKDFEKANNSNLISNKQNKNKSNFSFL